MNWFSFLGKASILFCLISNGAASFWDQIPLISQIKSLVQVTVGDVEGARQTQDNFLHSAILPIAPIKALVHTIQGDHDKAEETAKRHMDNVEGIVDSIPVVGHVKGGVHYALGDTKRGDEIMKSASRPVGVIAGGVGGFVVGGPVGAVAGGVAGGVAVDGIITGIDSAVNKNYTPYGHVHTATKIAKWEAKAGDYFDGVLNVAGDGVGGYMAGTSIAKPSAPVGKANSGGSGSTVSRGASNAKPPSYTQAIREGSPPKYNQAMGAVTPPKVSSSAGAFGKILPQQTNIIINRVILDMPDVPLSNPSTLVKSPPKVGNMGPLQPKVSGRISPQQQNAIINKILDNQKAPLRSPSSQLSKPVQPITSALDAVPKNPVPNNPFSNPPGTLAGPVPKWINDLAPPFDPVNTGPLVQVKPPSVRLQSNQAPISHMNTPYTASGPITNPIIGGSSKVNVGVGVRTGSRLAAAVVVGTLTSDAQKRQDDQTVPQCRGLPNIANSNRNGMRICENAQAGYECELKCLPNHLKSHLLVDCVQTAPDHAEWNTEVITCSPNRVVCRDRDNTEVDWFIMYRLPKSSGDNIPGGVDEDSYLLMTDTKFSIVNDLDLVGLDNNWERNYDFSIFPWGRNPHSKTLAAIYDAEDGDDVNYMMYSDQPPIGGTAGNTYGHVKGVLASFGDTGFYLSHHLPKFPDAKGHNDHDFSDVNGQLFMCISMSTEQLALARNHVMATRPYIYPHRGHLGPLPIVPPAPISVRSLGNKVFDLFAKTAANQHDIYSRIIAPYYGMHLRVASWSRNGGPMSSICAQDNNGWQVENVREMRIQRYIPFGRTNLLARWKIGTDHSKWAVQSNTGGQPPQLFCMGDLNRENSQLIRPGGAICMRDQRVASTFSDMIVEIEPCVPRPPGA